MKWNYLRGWKKLVYDLWYPGVLGSMIFDSLDPLRHWSVEKIGPGFIALAFVADFFYMKMDLKTEKKHEVRYVVYDAIVATCFCLAYFMLAGTTVSDRKSVPPSPACCGSSLAFLADAYLLILLYDLRVQVDENRLKLGKLLPFAVMSIGLCVMSGWVVVSGTSNPVRPTIIVTALSSIFYTLFVFEQLPRLWGVLWRAIERVFPALSPQQARARTGAYSGSFHPQKK
jgi:hypothetical protein